MSLSYRSRSIDLLFDWFLHEGILFAKRLNRAAHKKSQNNEKFGVIWLQRDSNPQQLRS